MKQIEPRGERLNICLFGKTNSGKSSLINALCGQEISIVDKKFGTTTDPVAKRYELIPIGPVTFFDTAGLDDHSNLGEKRIKASLKILYKTDFAILVIAEKGILHLDLELIEKFKRLNINFIIAFNKNDILKVKKKDLIFCQENTYNYELINTNSDLTNFKNKIINLVPQNHKEKQVLLDDIIKKSDNIILNCPQDASAPQHRLILPQVQVLRNILDNKACAIVVQTEQLKASLASLKKVPELVITDSQAIEKVNEILSEDIKLTTFSIIFARYKGNLNTFTEGASRIDLLKNKDKILIVEACSHSLQDDDIAKVKIPQWLKNYTKKDFAYSFISGKDYPENLANYKLIIHCGACMLNKSEMNNRILLAKEAKVPITNFGIAICKLNGVLNRVLAVFKE